MFIWSLIDKIEESIVTGIISLAIMLATVRANVAKFLADLQWPGFLLAFVICLLVTLSFYLFLSLHRRWSRGKRGRSDEEAVTTFENFYPGPGGRIYFLPVIFEGPPQDYYGFQVGGAIRLDDSEYLAEPPIREHFARHLAISNRSQLQDA
ncbi:hypothetical protein CPB84DRAFT_1788413 [Gymnopilus junonius]|uniref:Uncharacterized protein n=1 Tax=Gymnopilus junonius TaxID=109634 RepID=A0A9P5NIG6_GYMJU|nr:hypothetical protein CPB84DRAFT_1788413 [Gymnopilus junonius]